MIIGRRQRIGVIDDLRVDLDMGEVGKSFVGDACWAEVRKDELFYKWV